MNSVCTNIIHLTPESKVFKYYTGNFDQMIKTKEELETNQMKAFHKQQAEIDHMKKFISSVGTYANLVKQGALVVNWKGPSLSNFCFQHPQTMLTQTPM